MGIVDICSSPLQLLVVAVLVVAVILLVIYLLYRYMCRSLHDSNYVPW